MQIGRVWQDFQP